MKKNNHFLNAGEVKEFYNLSNRMIERTLTRANNVDDKSNKTYRTSEFIKEKIDKLKNNKDNKFSCCDISIKNDDGMSWTAEDISCYVKKHFPNFYCWELTNNSVIDSLPVVTNIIGKSKFMRYAVKYNLTSDFFSLRSWFSIILIVLTILFSILMKYYELSSSQATFSVRDILNFNFFVYIFIGSIVSIMVKYFAIVIQTNPKSKSIERLIENYDHIYNKNQFFNFVEFLSEKMTLLPYPRVFIVDNFSRLDPTTQEVLKSYISNHTTYNQGLELWIILENDSESDFKKFAIESNNANFKMIEFYEQNLLTIKEKKGLLSSLNKPLKRAEFSSVKWVCKDLHDQSKLYEVFFSQEADENIDRIRFNTLDFYYLLANNTIHGNISLSWRYIEKNFTPKKLIRSRLLEHILNGCKLTKDEFSIVFNDVKNKYKKVIDIENGKSVASLSPTKEASIYLTDNYKSFHLHRIQYIQVYWTLFWYDKLQNHPLQSFWITKLSSHILDSNIALIPNEALYKEVLDQFINALIYCIDGCIKTCSFERINSLLEKLVNLFELTDNSKDEEIVSRKVLRILWDVFSLLGDEYIFSLILKVYSNKIISESETNYEVSKLEQLYIEWINNVNLDRSDISKLFNFLVDKVQNKRSISIYSKSWSIWFLNIVNPFIINIDSSFLFESSKIAAEEIKNIFSYYEKIIDKNAESIKAIDIITLSLGVWNFAISSELHSVNEEVLQSFSKNTSEPSSENKKSYATLFQEIEKSSIKFDELIDMIESIYLFTSYVSEEQNDLRNRKYNMNFIMGGFSRQLCTLSIASLIIAFKNNKRLELNNSCNNFIEKINSILTFYNFTLGDNLKQINKLNDLLSYEFIKHIDNSFNICSIIWEKLNLNHLQQFINLCRIQFNTICINENSREYSKMLNHMSYSVSENNNIGVLSNIQLAITSRNSLEIASFYFNKAGQTIINNDYGAILKKEISLIAISFFSTVINDKKYLVQLTDGNIKDTFLFGILNSMSLDLLPSFILDILNLIYQVNDELLEKKILGILGFISKQYEEIDFRIVMSHIAEYQLKKKLQENNIISPLEILKDWGKWKDLCSYSSVLTRLLINDKDNDTIIKECLVLLNRDPSEDSYNGYIQLSLILVDILQDLGKKEEMETPMLYIRDSIYYFEKTLHIEKILEAYQQLYHYYPEHSNIYEERHEKFFTIKLKRDHLKKLPDLASQGNFFLIFFNYFKTMKIWGIRLDISFNEYFERLNQQQKWYTYHYKEHLDSRINEYCTNITPIIRIDEEIFLSSKFLLIGDILFFSELLQDNKYNQLRNQINILSQQNLQTLINIIVNLTKLPNNLKQLFMQYTSRLKQYTIPD